MGAATGTVTITNDDAIPTISIGSTSILEGDRGTQVVAVPITLSGPSAFTITVTVRISGGTATSGTDYLAWSPTTQTVTFAPGVTSQSVSISVVGDKSIEPDETVILSLSSATNATVATGNGTVTIKDNDGRLMATAVAPAGTTHPRLSAKALARVLQVAKQMWIKAGASRARRTR